MHCHLLILTNYFRSLPPICLAVFLLWTAIAAAVQAQVPARLPVPGAPAGVMAFVGVNVVPMDTERVLPDQTVLVQHGWITALGPSSAIQVPAGAVRIDGQDKYLLPGLADMHAHFANADSALMARQLFLWLADGTTTVRSMDYTDSGKGEAALRLREPAAAGALWSPRLYLSAPWAPRNKSYMFPPASGVPPAALDSVAAYVAEYKAQGYDHIKLYNEHGEVFDSLVAAARRLGVPLVGHAPRKETLERVLAARIGSMEHLSGYYDSLFKLVQDSGGAAHIDTMVAKMAEATRRAGVWNTPTFAIMEPSLEKFLQREERLRGAAPVVVSAVRRLVKMLYGQGTGLLLGTDKRAPKAIQRELQALVRAGLTPYQALVTGTYNVAVFYRALDERGTVGIGKRADLVLLAGDPLQDIRNTEQVAGVMIGGRWLSGEEIDRRLAEMKAALASSP
jgi:imidazolonepropionase-like amidohydrolase